MKFILTLPTVSILTVAKNVLPVYWLDVHPIRLHRTKTLLRAAIERFRIPVYLHRAVRRPKTPDRQIAMTVVTCI